MHAKELVSRDIPALSSITADLSQGERCCLCSNTIRDILPRGTIVRRWLNALQMEEGGIHTASAVLEECRGGWARSAECEKGNKHVGIGSRLRRQRQAYYWMCWTDWMFSQVVIQQNTFGG